MSHSGWPSSTNTPLVLPPPPPRTGSTAAQPHSQKSSQSHHPTFKVKQGATQCQHAARSSRGSAAGRPRRLPGRPRGTFLRAARKAPCCGVSATRPPFRRPPPPRRAEARSAQRPPPRSAMAAVGRSAPLRPPSRAAVPSRVTGRSKRRTGDESGEAMRCFQIHLFI